MKMLDRSVVRIAETFTHLRELGAARRDLLIEILHSVLESDTEALGFWSVWEPDALDGADFRFKNSPGHDANGRFIPYWHRALGAARLDCLTGYEKPGPGDWYWVPKTACQLCELDPYPYLVAGRMRIITSEVAPVVVAGRCLGVVGVDYLAEPASSQRRGADRFTLNPQVRVVDENHAAAALRHLTPREREVHHWLTQGKSNDEIGRILGISAHTVKNHLERIFQKLGVENRHAAALHGL
jgi:DNA-binding CsgD family transcriptional regulator